MITSYTNPMEVKRVEEFVSHLEESVENDMFYKDMASFFLKEEAIPDTIFEVADEIENTDIDEVLFESSNDEGTNMVAKALNISKDKSKKFLQDPQSASILFRSLRDKLEEMEDAQKRATAEKSGFIATVIYTIKKAMSWIIKKFNDIRDYLMDSFAERPAGSSQAKRDYNWIKNKEADYLARNTSWYLNSEH